MSRFSKDENRDPKENTRQTEKSFSPEKKKTAKKFAKGWKHTEKKVRN